MGRSTSQRPALARPHGSGSARTCRVSPRLTESKETGNGLANQLLGGGATGGPRAPRPVVTNSPVCPGGRGLSPPPQRPRSHRKRLGSEAGRGLSRAVGSGWRAARSRPTSSLARRGLEPGSGPLPSSAAPRRTRALRPHFAQVGRRLRRNRVGQSHRVRLRPRPLPGEDLERHHAQGVDVHCGGGGSLLELLRSHISECAQNRRQHWLSVSGREPWQYQGRPA